MESFITWGLDLQFPFRSRTLNVMRILGCILYLTTLGGVEDKPVTEFSGNILLG